MDPHFEFKNVTRFLTPWDIEKFNVGKTQVWVQDQQHAVIFCSIVYVALTFLGREWMRDRKPYKLRGALIIWNGILAVFSTIGFWRTFPTFVALLLQPHGIYRSVCTLDYSSEPEAFWGLMYTISKLFEFIDTIFIILRKAPLLFLHWYHHASMSIFMFYLYPIADPVGRWGGILNYGVHSIMYTYYSIKMAGVHVPKRISSLITSMQMGQFGFTLFANIYALVMIGMGEPCRLSNTTIVIQFIGGVSYLVLFANYYIQTYVKKKPKTA